jgi:hypothetical protein
MNVHEFEQLLREDPENPKLMGCWSYTEYYSISRGGRPFSERAKAFADWPQPKLNEKKI